MRVIVQRVKKAEVKVNNQSCGQIAAGYLLLVGFKADDSQAIIDKIALKINNLRIFADEAGKMNKAIDEIGGAVYSVPQFTLYGDVNSGRRPSFSLSAPAAVAEKLYESFNEALRKQGLTVVTGIFQAEMAVELINDGPVTLIIDSEDFK